MRRSCTFPCRPSASRCSWRASARPSSSPSSSRRGSRSSSTSRTATSARRRREGSELWNRDLEVNPLLPLSRSTNRRIEPTTTSSSTRSSSSSPCSSSARSTRPSTAASGRGMHYTYVHRDPRMIVYVWNYLGEHLLYGRSSIKIPLRDFFSPLQKRPLQDYFRCKVSSVLGRAYFAPL